MKKACLIISLIFPVVCISAAEIPVGNPITEPLFVVARDLYGRGALRTLEYSRLGELSLNDANDTARKLGKRFDLLSQDYYSAGRHLPGLRAGLELVESNRQNDGDINYVKFFPYVRADFNEKLSANLLYRIDAELDNDPRYDGKSWDGIAGFPENATLDYRADDFSLRFGIERLSWGFGQYSNLTFARQAMPMTVVGLSYRRSIFDFESVVGFLSPLKDQLDLMENDTSFFTSQQRYLAAHSLTLRPLGGLSVSLREIMLYGGPGRRFEPAYAIPFIWYHGQQLNSRMDDNAFFALAADYRALHKVWVYSEFLIDDFQTEKKTRGDYEPNQLGFISGIEAYDLPIEGMNYELEYARINNWTYNQARAHNRYLNSNFPIGFSDGPDVDILSWQVSWWHGADIRIAYSGSYRRRGEGRINTPWSRPWLSVDEYSEPFPTGTVERKLVNGIELLAFHKNWIWGNFTLKFTDIANVENIPGREYDGWEMVANVGVKLPPFSWEF
jgi:hypothetical protein